MFYGQQHFCYGSYTKICIMYRLNILCSLVEADPHWTEPSTAANWWNHFYTSSTRGLCFACQKFLILFSWQHMVIVITYKKQYYNFINQENVCKYRAVYDANRWPLPQDHQTQKISEHAQRSDSFRVIWSLKVLCRHDLTHMYSCRML